MIQPHELADMRRTADKAPFDLQQKFHALLDAYEDREEEREAGEDLETLKSTRDDAVRTLRGVYSKLRSERPKFETPLTEDEWADKLSDCRTPEERAATAAEELDRARAAEAKLLGRVEALEEAIESALDDLED